MGKKKFPKIEIENKEYKVHAGLIALDSFHELSGRHSEDLFADMAAESKAKKEGTKVDKKVRFKEMAQFYFCTLTPIKHDGITFDEFFIIIDEDPDTFKKLTDIVSKQLAEKKE